jgi:hypothetical protein
VKEMSIERLQAEKRPIWESVVRNQVNDSSLVIISKNAAKATEKKVPSPSVL